MMRYLDTISGIYPVLIGIAFSDTTLLSPLLQVVQAEVRQLLEVAYEAIENGWFFLPCSQGQM